MNIPDEIVRVAIEAAYPVILEDLSLPYGASARDYPKREDLAAADAECERKNTEIIDRVIRAALEAAAPLMLAGAWRDGCAEGLSWNPGYDDEAQAENPYGRPAK